MIEKKTKQNNFVLGVIGGSGVYDINGVEDGQWVKVDTPFGAPSDEIFTGRMGDLDVAFLPRHGRGHIFSPSTVPYQANVYAMKLLGVTDLLSISACGSLREDFKPGEFVIVDQFIDRTFARKKTFFEGDCVAHVSVAHPVCSRLGRLCGEAMKSLGISCHAKGTYIAMEGPQFSTMAESRLYKENWHCDVIGMTNMPEAKLVREAEICYSSIAMVTDFDCWHPDHESVDVQQIVKVLLGNAEKAKVMIKNLIDNFEDHIDPNDPTNNCLDVAIITAPEKRTQKTIDKLKTVAGRALIK